MKTRRVDLALVVGFVFGFAVSPVLHTTASCNNASNVNKVTVYTESPAFANAPTMVSESNNWNNRSSRKVGYVGKALGSIDTRTGVL